MSSRLGPKPIEPIYYEGRCTAPLTPNTRCGKTRIAREFVPALYPDGPPIRLCRGCVGHFHQLCVLAARVPPKPGALDRFVEACDEWREWA